MRGTIAVGAASASPVQFFTNMIGTLAIILVIASFIGGSDVASRFFGRDANWKKALISGVMGGIFGVYGTISGLELNGAIISVRDIGPMLAGFTGGPLGGLIAGVIAGVHRFLVGSRATETARLVTCACIIATVSIGVMCGFLSKKLHHRDVKPHWALLTGAVMELFHLSLVLIIVKPFSAALDIVKAIAIPFVLVNALGLTLVITMINYFERQRTINLERSRLKTELEVANEIQRSLLPPITDSYPGRQEVGLSASMTPAKEVGGDFYDFFFTEKDKLAFVIADVSGKGIPAALFMANSKTTIQNCVRDYPKLSEAVMTANESLCVNNTAEMFVTAWIGVLDIPTGDLTFVCAGHNPPVLISGGKTEFIRMRGGFVLGGMGGARYRENTVRLKKGDRLFLYTDGVTEAENGAHELFGEGRLEACLDAANSAYEMPEPEEIIEYVKEALQNHADGADQFDDITMLCLSYNGGQERAALQN